MILPYHNSEAVVSTFEYVVCMVRFIDSSFNWFHEEGRVYLGRVAGRRPPAGFLMLKYSFNSSYTLWCTSEHSRRSWVKELARSATGMNANASSMCVNCFTVLLSGFLYCSCSPSS